MVGLVGGRRFEHAALWQHLQPWLKEWGVVAVACVITIVAVIYAWFALELWMVEDRIPGNRTRAVLVGALIATAFAVFSVMDYPRERPKKLGF